MYYKLKNRMINTNLNDELIFCLCMRYRLLDSNN